MDAFEVLGVSRDATQEEVQTAYRCRVKRCHPDQFQNKDEQDRAQEELIQLNLAYEEAMRVTAQRRPRLLTVSLSEAKRQARNLHEQGRPESALRQLMRADGKDAEWYFLQGDILMTLKQYGTAHQSYREAVRREPDNMQFRRGALNAAVAVREHSKPMRRAMDKLGTLFRKR